MTAGLDFALTIVAELRARTYPERCQLMSEYDPDPPFHARSIKTAPPKLKAPMDQMLKNFVKKSEALAAETKACIKHEHGGRSAVEPFLQFK